MLDPHITKYGNTFDKEPLFEYVNSQKKDPIEHKSLNTTEIFSNLNMKHAIEDYIK